MRIATWNVNSLKARLEKVKWWLDRAAPDVLLLQETKLADADVPHGVFEALGYRVAHHGEGRWNGVAIVSRVGLADVASGLGTFAESGSSAASPVDAATTSALSEARFVAATCGGIRVVSLYAPNGRTVGSPFYAAKLVWFERLARWLDTALAAALANAARDGGDAAPLVLGGDFNVAPDDRDVWDAAACHGGTHVSPAERDAFARLLATGDGFVDAYRKHHEEAERYSWWDYRAGDFYKNFGMRIDHLLVARSLDARVVAVEIDREARKGKPIPSDHAPVVLDLDAPGRAFDPGWAGAAERIAARRVARDKKK